MSPRRVRPIVLLVTLLLAPMALAGCTQSPTVPSNFAEFKATDLTVGTGATAAEANFVEVNYTGWLYNASKPDQKGAAFDTNLGGAPFDFFLSTGEVIPGWDIGLVGMKEGGIRRLVIPPSLAYGGSRNSIIPAFATLVFEVEMVRVTVLVPDPVE